MEMLVNKQEYIIPPNNYGPLNSKVYEEGMNVADKFCKVVAETFTEELKNTKYPLNIGPMPRDWEDLKNHVEIECKDIYDSKLRQYLSAGPEVFMRDILDTLESDSILTDYLIDFVPLRYSISQIEELQRRILRDADIKFNSEVKTNEDVSEIFYNFYRDFSDLREKESKL